MIGSDLSHYKILEKLGEGGMGVVYKALDTKLNRPVALKFLPDHLTANQTEQSRFLQEAQAAATINHPNVCTIYDIREESGKHFIVMEYVDGANLRGSIPIRSADDALSYAIQIGEALHEAHGKGIVHRDIKAENIMLNAKHQIKVMDFGLAKLKGSLKLTRTSSTVGTLAYMAPEQIQSGDVDARSDIFSFGVVLFEMLAGRMPFRGEHEAAIMYSILNEAPESVLTHRSDVPPELDRIIKRALEKDPADRYQHIDDMVSEIRRLKKQSTRVIRPEIIEQSARPTVAGKKNRQSWMLIWAGIVVVALIGAFVFLPRLTNPSASDNHGGRKMVAILPFENLGSPDQEYFADGITEEITSKLSGISGLGVIARSSAMQYKKTSKPIKQIAEELGVSYILQGTIRWENEGGTSRVRVNPQLINAADGTQMWSQPSEAVLASAFKIQSDIASQVASALNVTLLQHEKQSLEAKLTENSEAYDAYLRGAEYLYRSTGEQDVRIAEQLHERAVELDPKFVAAYSRLAAIHSHIYWEYYDHTPERVRKSKEAAETAMRLDPNAPEAHGAMGWYYYHCLRDYEKALKEFNLALEQQPNNTDYLLGVGAIDRRVGKFDEAIGYFTRICEIDPRSPGMLVELANTHVPIRRYADAIRFYDRVLALAPDITEIYYAKAQVYLLWEGTVVNAQKALDDALQQKLGSQDRTFQFNRIALRMLGRDYQGAMRILDSLDTNVFDYQYWHIPKANMTGEIYGYLKKPLEQKTAYESARVFLESELRDHPDDPRIHSSLGIAYAGLSRKEEAIREGKRATELLPTSIDAAIGPIRMFDLARIYVMTGHDDEAMDMLEKLLSMPSYVSGPYLRLDPTWDRLRNNPRFQKLSATGS